LGRRALVTGAGGFVGAALVRHLLAAGDDVTAFVRPGSPLWRLQGIGRQARVSEVDMRDADCVAAQVKRAAPNVVFHLAAHGAYSWQTDVLAILETNAVATAALLEAAVAAGAGAFVQAGSSSEYGLKDHAPREDELPEPNSAYAVGKLAATFYGQWVAAREQARVVTLRLYSVYGPWEEPGRLVPTLIEHGLRGALPQLVSPDTARDFVYVDDVCRAFVRAAEAPSVPLGAVYNVGTGRQTTLSEIVAVARDVLGVSAEPEWGSAPARSWDTDVWFSDPRRIERDLGWRAETALGDGLRAMTAWMTEDPARLERYRPASAAAQS
jgi:nucleoside-diphosphate-sugar epimerase